LAWTMLKGTVKCDICCELQNSVNQNDSQCILCLWDIPVSTPSSVCEYTYTYELCFFSLIYTLFVLTFLLSW